MTDDNNPRFRPSDLFAREPSSNVPPTDPLAELARLIGRTDPFADRARAAHCRRGLHRLPALTAETRFPLGTFRVWTVWRTAAQILVYPLPELNPPPLPPGEPRSGGAAAAA